MRSIAIASSSGGTGGAPAVTITGTTAVGSVLTASITSGYGGTLTYQWVRGADGASDLTGASNISGATSSTYTLVSGDIGRVIGCLVSGLTYQGRTSGVIAGIAPGVTTAPAIVGTPAVGAAASYTTGTYSGTTPITKAVQWLLDGAVIVGETGSTYTPITADEGKSLAIRETASNAWGSAASTSSGAIIAAAGAGGGPLALRGASTLNAVAPKGYATGSDTRPDNVYRIPFVLGSCDWVDLRASLFNWVFEQWGISFSGGTDYEIPELAIEIGGQYKAITWGGLPSKTVTNGTTDINSDPVYPADFGISGGVFPRGTEGFWRIRIRADASHKWPKCPLARPSGNKWRYNESEIDMSPGVYGVGEFIPSSYAGVEPAGGEPMLPVLIGTPAASGKFLAGVGDSITAYVGDSAATHARGFSRAAYSDYATKANPLACINFGWPGGTVLNWIGNGTSDASLSSATATNVGLPEAYLKYANIVFEQYGTNNVQQAHVSKLWTVIKRGGGASGFKLVRTSLFPSANSSDSFATLGNQTNWQNPGGEFDVFEQYCASQVGTGVDYYLNYNSLRADSNRASANYFKWLTNGTANWPTTDGIHPSSNTCALIYGGEARALIDTITP